MSSTTAYKSRTTAYKSETIAYKSGGTAPSLFSTSTKFETKTWKVRNEELQSFIRSSC
ncbi:MAG: hypothetical protein IIT55_09250 [Bacteroidaceae bacterium]|nr:hypothetical protein [Bacteroidaceae bacterium]MBO7559529.1 hypothetical protein [Bacteroidaceae bacterium]MBQ5462008.1 hypothetical protein [Bacteroidaceae bacterium]